MKKVILAVFAAFGLTVARAASVPLVPEGATALHSISSKAADTGSDVWASNQVGPYLQINNADKSAFVLQADDTVEVKFKFNEVGRGACIFCDRKSSSAGKFNFMRTGDAKGRFDYGTENNTFTSPSINDTSKHMIVANGTSLKVDETSVTVASSTYAPSSNALLIFCCDNSGNGIANSGNTGSITMYYFRVKDGSGNIRLNLVPMKDANGVVGMYDQVNGLFFKSGNSHTFTAGSTATEDDIKEYFLPQSEEPVDPEPGELTMLSPADGATVALLTDRQKGWIALEPEDRVKVLVSDSSAPVAYKDVTSADFSNGSPVTFTWSGATGAVTLTVKKGDATVETVTTSASSATVYNLELGVTYTWTLTSGNVTTEAFTFTTESNPPRIIKAGTMSLLRDLCGWTGLQGCKIRANQVFRGAPPNVSSSPFESRLDAQGVDFWQNRVGLKTQIDFRNASEVAEAGANGKLTFVDNYCNYNIEYYKAYAPSEVASGAGKNFLDAVRTILTSSKRPVYFHCKWGRDRTGTMASVILGVLGVSEDDIIDDYHMSPLYNGNQPREYFNNFVSFLTSIKTTYPADTLAKSVEKYFLAIGITKTEIETFRTEMLDGYEPSEEPAEDPTWEPPAGATFYEKLANDTRAVTSSDYATGGDYIYKVSDTEYIHVFKSSNTFTLNQDLANVQLLVVGGGGSGGGRYGAGGGAGGVVYQSGRALSAGSYTITVGAGGASVSAKSSGKNGGNSTFSGAGIETVTAIGGGGGGGYYMAGMSGGSGGGASGQVGKDKDGKTDNVGGAGTAGQGYAGGIASTVGNYPARGGGGGAGEAGGNADVGGRGNQPTNEGYIGGNGGNGLDYGTQMLGYAQYFGGGGGGSTTKDTADAVNYRGLGGLGGGGSGAYLRGETATTPDKSALQATAGENGLGGGGGGGCVAWGNRETETGAAGGKGIVIVRYQLTGDDPTIDPTTIEPANLRPVSTQDSPTELLTEDQQTWIYTFTKEQRYGLMANDTTLSPSSAWNTKDIVLFSNGSPLTLAWEGTAGRSCTVELTRLSDNKRIFSKTVSGYSVTVYNLEIGAGYSWSVTCEGKTASAEFHTSPTAPRLLKTGAMRCMRDLGGWTGLQGCKIRQNEIIRGGPANDPDHVSDASLRYADDQAYDFFFNELGLKTEIDLRTTSEIGGNNGKLDVQGTHGVTYKNLHIYENTLYSLSNPSDDQRSFVEIFKTIFNAAKRPVYFHCARGRDRTGTVAMMCEAILGVSEDDIWRDYQSSVFNPPTRSTGTVWGDMTTRYNGFKNFLEQIKSTYPADTLAESAEKYLLSLGFTKDEIETFRTDMLIGYVTPEEPTEPTDPTDKPVIVDGQFITSLQTFAATHPITTPLASGAQISYQQGDDQYYIFTQSGTLTVSSAVTANLLAVGGGGAGGFNCGGGGAGGGVTEVSDQALAAESYAVTVGHGGAKNEDKSGQGGSGGSSSFATLCTAVGGAGGYGYNHATKGSQGGAAAGGGGAGGAASKTECVGTAGGDGKVSEILGFAQTFGGGGGGGNRGNTSSVSAQGGAGGGGAGATVRGSTTTTNAEEGEDGLGGGGGGGAGNTGAQAGDKKTADGGDGIVIVCIKGSADPGKIAIPTAKENLVYTGEEQIGVEPGTGYTLTGNTGTNAKGYTAVATLNDPETTKWADETTEPKEINWSIVKAVNAWTTEPSLSKTTWSVNQSPATLTVGAAAFGTMMATLNGETFDLANPVFPTETGEYTLVFTVIGSDDYGDLEKKITFTITEAPLYSGYYKVGEDTGSHSSFAKSDSSTSGWSSTQDGTIDANHIVSADGDYIVPSDTVLRTQSLDADDTFAGRSLTLAGGSLTLKRKGYETQANKTVTVSQLVLTDGGAIKHASDKTDFTLNGTSVTIPDGTTGAIEINGGNRRGIIVKSAICGNGTLQLTWQGSGSAPSSQDDYLKLTGDNSGFTGTLKAVGDTSVASTKYTLVLDGKFGGTITSLPKAKTNSIKVNYGNNPGLTVATTTIPAALKKDLLFYGSTDFAATPSLPLMTFPAGTAVDPADFTIKYASGEAAPTTTAFTGLGTIENADGTITLAANCGKPPAGTTFYQKLENDTRKVNSSDYATGGDYIYQVGGKEYIHVFKTTGSSTFTPKQDLADVQVLVVGGGGSGGFSAGGGGGAGGLIYKTDLSLFANTGYAVTVGAGGAGTALKSNVEASQAYCTGNSGQNSVFDTLTAVGGGFGGAGQTVSQNGAAGGSGGGATGSGMPGAGSTNQGFAGGTGGTGDAVKYTSGGGGGGAGATGANAGERGTSYAFAGNGGDGLEIGMAILGYQQYFAGGGGGGTTGSSEDRRAAGGLGGGGAGAVDDGDAATHVDAKAGENGLGGGGGGGAIWWNKTCQSKYNGAAGGNGIVIVRYSIVEDPNRNKWVTPPSITKTSWLEGWESGIVTAPTAKFGEPIATLNDVIWDGEMPTEAGTYTITWTAPKYQEGGDDQITISLDFEILAFTPPTGNTFYDRIKNDMRNLSDASACIGATGGDYIYEDDGYYIHIFKNSGSFTPKKNLSEVQLLLVGGGGTGGGDCGGGGGAGGVVYATDITLSEGVAYTATVGAGGKITSLKQQYSGSSTTFKAGSTAVPGVDEAKGGGCGGLWDTGTKKNGANGGSGGGACGAGAVGTATSGQGHNGGLGASSDVGGGGGGAGAAGAAASGSSGTGKGGAGGAGYDYGIAMLGYEQYFGGGGGGGTCSKTEADRGAGGLGGGGAGAYFKNGSGQSTNGIAGNGEDGLGGGGGGASGGGGTAYAGSGGKGVVIIRYPIPYDMLNTEITGTIAMPDWKEGETPSEPDLTGLTVTPDMAAPALLVKYYADADCTQALDAKPAFAGTYYVRAEIEKTRQYTAAVSAVTEFTIKSGEKIVVPIPEVSSFGYDGTPKTCVEAGDGYTIDSASTVTATNAGDYSVTLKLNDPETSQWSDFTSADKVIPWSIAQAENEWTTEAAIDKTEWMKTLDEPGKLTAPVAKFGTLVATLNGQVWDGALPTEVGLYTAKWTVEETENYTGLEVTLSFRIKPDFHTNAWKTEPTISKTSWKSTEEPATITPAEASYGNDTMSVKISVDNGPFVDWDGKVPTTKGAYKIQWVVEETESYSRLEKTIEFLIDRRYCPTHPFMYQKAGDTTWKGANTFAAALAGITDGTGTIELCQDITDATVDKIGTLNYKSITLRSNPDDDQIYVWTRLGKSYNGFQVQNSSKLTIADIVLNITANGSGKMINLFELGASANENGGEVTLGAGAVVQGEVSGSLYTTEKGSSFVLNGGTIRNLTAGSSLLPVPKKSFSVKSGTIENCTVNGAIIPLGDNTLNLSDVTITNNTTTAGAITVGEAGIIKVSGDVIVKNNKVGDDEKNIVLQNAANLQMTGALGATASVGVSFGAKGEDFGAFTSETAGDKKSAAKFFNDADSTRKLVGRVNDKGKLVWWNSPGMLILFNFN